MKIVHFADASRRQALGKYFANEFTTNEILRKSKEDQWLEDLRAFKRKYDPDVTFPKNASRIYPGYTRSKVIPAIAKLNSLIFPSNDRNWEADITPLPKVNDEKLSAIVNSLAEEYGEFPNTDQVKTAVREFARTAMMRMQTAIDDQLVDARFVERAGKPAVRYGVLYGTGIIKGPLNGRRIINALQKSQDGQNYSMVEERLNTPVIEHTPMWWYYPDMNVTEQKDAQFEYELHSPTRYQLRQLARRGDFDGDAIKRHIESFRDGDYRLRQWETEIQAIRDESRDRKVEGRYELLERWGFIDGYMLKEAGIMLDEEDFDFNQEYYSNFFILGEDIVKAILTPLPYEGSIYHLFYYEKDESSIFADGLARAVRDTTLSIAASSRAMLNNAAIVAGPMYEVATSLLNPEEDVEDIHSLRVWEREDEGQTVGYPAVRPISADSHIEDFIRIIREFKQIGDEESAFPSVLYGEPRIGSNETVGGMQIRAENVNTTVSDQVKNFDSCFESFLHALYRWNMEFNPDESIKADGKMKARGYSSLLSKGMRMDALSSIYQGIKPEDRPYLRIGELLREIFKLHDLDAERHLRSDQEAQEYITTMKDNEIEALRKALMEAEREYTLSKADHMRAKADATAQEVPLKAAQTFTDMEKMEREEERSMERETGNVTEERRG